MVPSCSTTSVLRRAEAEGEGAAARPVARLRRMWLAHVPAASSYGAGQLLGHVGAPRVVRRVRRTARPSTSQLAAEDARVSAYNRPQAGREGESVQSRWRDEPFIDLEEGVFWAVADTALDILAVYVQDPEPAKPALERVPFERYLVEAA
jgi:hypothetical protein